MVARGRQPVLLVDDGVECRGDIFRQLFRQMYGKVVFPFGLENDDRIAVGCQCTGVTDLTAHFGVERRLAQYDLIQLFIFLFDLPVAQDFGVAFGEVVTYKLRFSLFQYDPVAGFDSGGIACAFFLLLHLCVEFLRVYRQSVFFQDQFCQVERESVRVVERESLFAVDHLFSCGFCVVHHFVQQPDAGFECAEECFFFLFDHFFDQRFLRYQFGVCTAHCFDQYIYQPIEECLTLSEECVSVTDGTAQDAADYISGFGVRRQLSVGDREGDRADMVGDYTHSHIVLPVFSVFLTAHISDNGDDRLEYVGVVVRCFAL